jgi:hypothetical protein
LHGQEAVRVLLLADAFEEDGEVVVVVQLGHVDLPVDFVLRSMLDSNGEVSAIVETAELAGSDHSAGNCACLGSLDLGSWLRLVHAECLSARAFTFLQD